MIGKRRKGAEALIVEPLSLKEARGLSPELVAALAQAASVCFEHQGHSTGSVMEVDGDAAKRFAVLWDETTELTRRSWADLQEATEWGAASVAVALVPRLSGLTVVERSCKGTGFDYWLGAQDDNGALFQKKGQLEVSGILSGSHGELGRRTREKVEQIDTYESPLAGIVVVVEFREPRSRVVLKWKK